MVTPAFSVVHDNCHLSHSEASVFLSGFSGFAIHWIDQNPLDDEINDVYFIVMQVDQAGEWGYSS